MSFGSYPSITEHIHVFLILYVYYRTYTCISDLIHVFQFLYMSYRVSTCITELILILRNLLLSYGSYSCAKVPVGTISRNSSGSYHIPGQIRLIQIRTLIFRRYRSKIHYTEVTVVTIGLILILHNLYVFYQNESTCRYYRAYQIQEGP